MRKSLVIGAIAAGLIGVAAYVLWEPGKGTVEYHKEGYLKAGGTKWRNNPLVKNAPRFVQNAMWRFRARQMTHHHKELIRLGYLEEVTLVASNAPTDRVMSRVVSSFLGLPESPTVSAEVADLAFFHWAREGTAARFTCVRTNVGELRRQFAEADVDDATWDQRIPKQVSYE